MPRCFAIGPVISYLFQGYKRSQIQSRIHACLTTENSAKQQQTEIKILNLPLPRRGSKFTDINIFRLFRSSGGFYLQMVEIHFSWDRMYTYLRIRKFQLSRLNGVKISQFPWRVSILESSTIFSDESVSFVRGSASFHSFPTFEIRMGRGEGIWNLEISAKFLQIRSFSDPHHSD